jgi:hypothetical protein
MAKLVLLLVAAAWAAVLIPPLLRSRIENRPNNSVSDFRDQLSSLQKAMPARSVQMRTIGRGLVGSPLERPAAAGRPVDSRAFRGQRAHTHTSVRQGGQPGRMGHAAATPRMHEARLRSRSHGPAERREISARDAQKRRRANVLFLLVLSTGCSLYLAVVTEAPAAMYVFALAFLALAGYLYLLGQTRQRDGSDRTWTREPRTRDRWLDVA